MPHDADGNYYPMQPGPPVWNEATYPCGRVHDWKTGWEWLHWPATRRRYRGGSVGWEGVPAYQAAWAIPWQLAVWALLAVLWACVLCATFSRARANEFLR